MKKRMIMTVLAGSSLLISQNSFAEVSLIPRASVGVSHYSAAWDITAVWSDWGGDGNFNVLDVEDDLLTGGFGLTLAAGNFYFDASLEQTMEGSDEAAEENSGEVVTRDFDVFAYALTLGYNITGGLSAFGGWNGHKTSVSSQYSSDTFDSEFSSAGWFLGLSYGWAVLENSTLSIKAAYALLEGDIEGEELFDNNTKVTVNSDAGDAAGATIGLAWKSYLTESLSYSITADWYNYTYEDFTNEFHLVEGANTRVLPTTTSTSDVDEESYTFRFALSYLF